MTYLEVGGTAVAVATAGLLVWTGVTKAIAPSAPGALTTLLGGAVRARLTLRAVGVLELAAVGVLLAVPRAGGAVVAALGLGFVGYLLLMRRVAPGSSCGCAGGNTRVGWRGYVRAVAVAVAGATVGWLGVPAWRDAAASPVTFAGLTMLAVAAYLAVSAETDRWWLLPTRRLRLRLFGHPLAGHEGPVPVAASVDLLEASVAWRSATHLVQSSLLEHWLADGWRVLRYAGRTEGREGSRPVSVLFAVDAQATTSAPRGAAIRVSVVDDEDARVLSDPPLRVPRVRALPVVRAS